MLDLLYGQLADSRRRWYERHPEARRLLRGPVISVGNLSVGGTGKTPLVAQIASWLIDQGERPAILSRGYRRRTAHDGVTVVSDGSAVLADVDSAGDEPLMLARQIPAAIVCVGEDRHLAGALAERTLGATVHVLDDGFQHVQLARDLDVLVTEPGEITRGRVLPRGRLRERKEAAARAHFAVIVGSDRETARGEAWQLGVSAFSAATRRPGRFMRGAPDPLAGLIGSGALGVAGIGRPEQFFQMLRAGAVKVVGEIAYPDHHRYRPADIERIAAALASAGARVVVTTEKDLVRLESLGKLPFDVVAVPLSLELDDWHALQASLQHVLRERRRAA